MLLKWLMLLFGVITNLITFSFRSIWAVGSILLVQWWWWFGITRSRAQHTNYSSILIDGRRMGTKIEIKLFARFIFHSILSKIFFFFRISQISHRIKNKQFVIGTKYSRFTQCTHVFAYIYIIEWVVFGICATKWYENKWTANSRTSRGRHTEDIILRETQWIKINKIKRCFRWCRMECSWHWACVCVCVVDFFRHFYLV